MLRVPPALLRPPPTACPGSTAAESETIAAAIAAASCAPKFIRQRTIVGHVDHPVGISVGPASRRHAVAIVRPPNRIVLLVDDTTVVVITGQLRRRCVVPSRRTAVNDARSPVGRIVGIALRIDDLQRRAAAVGRDWPGTRVTVRHARQQAAAASQKRNRLARVAQIAGALTAGRQIDARSVHRSKHRRRASHDDVLSRLQAQIVGEDIRRIGKFGDLNPGKSPACVANVQDLDELLIRLDRRSAGLFGL